MKTDRRCAAVFLLFSLLAVQCAAAEENPDKVQEWLQKMARAAHTVNYDGNFVYSYDDQLHAMRIIHSADATGEKERLVSLNGPAREVLRDHDLVTCILSDNRSVVVERTRPAKQFPPTFPIHIDTLKDYYSFAIEGVERMAGQEAQKILIRPRDRYRYGYELWVDAKTGLLLKSDMTDEAGKPVEQFMFTEVHYLTDVPDKLLEPDVSGREFTWYEPPTADKDAPVVHRQWEAQQVPSGFSLDVYRKHKLATSDKPIVHMVYSDGMASVSVFIEKLTAHTDTLLGSSSMGAVNAFGRVLDDHYVTVVGEVPHATVMMMADSIRRADSK